MPDVVSHGIQVGAADDRQSQWNILISQCGQASNQMVTLLRALLIKDPLRDFTYVRENFTHAAPEGMCDV